MSEKKSAEDHAIEMVGFVAGTMLPHLNGNRNSKPDWNLLEKFFDEALREFAASEIETAFRHEHKGKNLRECWPDCHACHVEARVQWLREGKG